MVNVASIWEIAIKISIDKLKLKSSSLQAFVRGLAVNDIALLPVTADEAMDVAALPLDDHEDPFDRLIAVQCLRYDLLLVSIDTAFDEYGVPRIW